MVSSHMNKYGVDHTVDEYEEDHYYVVDNTTGDWIGMSHPTHELAAEAAQRLNAERGEES